MPAGKEGRGTAGPAPFPRQRGPSSWSGSQVTMPGTAISRISPTPIGGAIRPEAGA